MSSSLVPLDSSLEAFLAPYLPVEHFSKMFVMLTYAQSVDSKIAAEPGVQTKISSPQTKTMTHYIRSRFDAILVGVGTFFADNPSLNCRFVEGAKIRPVIVDPDFRSRDTILDSKVYQLAKEGVNSFPIVAVKPSLDLEFSKWSQNTGLEFLFLSPASQSGVYDWGHIFAQLHGKFGLQSVMVEGGAKVINSLLVTDLVDALVVTIGSVYLGQKGVDVSPSKNRKLSAVAWWTGDGDAVLAAKVSH